MTEYELQEAWAGRRVLVTGATGFIGLHLVHRLVAAGAQVWAGTFPQEHPQRVASLPPQAARLPLDVRCHDSVTRAVDQAAPQVVFHLAAVGVTGTDVDPHATLDANTGGTVRLLEAVARRPAERVVLAGTSYEYGARNSEEGFDPFNVYAASKVAAWAFGRAYWRAAGTPVVFARPFQVYGPGQSNRNLVPAAIHAALSGSDFPMTPGAQERDFVFVHDVADGLLAAAVAPGLEGRGVDLGTGTVCAIRQVVERIWALTNAQGRIRAGALPYRPAEVMHLVADAERTAYLIGWRATTPLDTGLAHTIQRTIEDKTL
ncbi:MAG: NAD(P)-dependent oxidoreductase [Anaerolineae bacterium]|nr:NAD(P)-dependent oxidoreductase [Anaerolineae bacterium]